MAMRLTGAALALPAASKMSGEAQARTGGSASSTGVGGFNVKSFGAKGDSDINASTGTDDTAAIQAAITYIYRLGGGTLYFPEGYYRITSFLTLCANLTIIGAGKKASYIVTAMTGGGGGSTDLDVRNGTALYSNWPSNSSINASIVIEHLALCCSNAGNVGAAFYDNCGTFITLRDCLLRGFKYGAIFDQSELFDVLDCIVEPANNQGAGIWLVNRGDLKVGNSSGFTNRGSVQRCQINAGGTVYGILDDGGNTHAFEDNNYNGCLKHIRVAGVVGLRISGGEFESAANENINFHAMTLAGSPVGNSAAVWLGGGAQIIPTAGRSCVVANSLGNITISGVFFGNTTAAKFVGAANCNSIYSIGAFNGGGGVTFDGRATNHFEIGHDGKSWGLRTNVPIEMSGGGIGYAPGAGGTVTQGTSKSTAVMLNKLSGQITLNAEALAPANIASFTLNNSQIAAGDVLVLNHVSGGTPGCYSLNARSANGCATIDIRNCSGESLSEAIVIAYVVIKAVAV